MSVILIILNRSWDQISPNSVVIETEVFLNVLEMKQLLRYFDMIVINDVVLVLSCVGENSTTPTPK